MFDHQRVLLKMYQNLCSTMGPRTIWTTFWPENLVIQRSYGKWHFSIDDSPIDNDDFPLLCYLVGGFNPSEKYESVGIIKYDSQLNGKINKMLKKTTNQPTIVCHSHSYTITIDSYIPLLYIIVIYHNRVVFSTIVINHSYIPWLYSWKITIFHGKIHYKWPFSIAFCLFTRPGTPNCRHFSSLRLNPGAARAWAPQQGSQLEEVSSRHVGRSKVLGPFCNKVGTQSASDVCWSRNPLNIT